MTPAESEQLAATLAATLAAEIYQEMNANVDAFWDKEIEYEQFHERQGELWRRAQAAGVVEKISAWIAEKTEHSR